MNQKKITKFIIFLCIINISCTKENIKEDNLLYKYESEKINLTELIVNQINPDFKEFNSESDYIYSEFITSLYIPESMNDSELEAFITDNLSSINGTLKYFINDSEFINIEFINGVEQNSEINTSNLLIGDYPCTYDGIQDCVQDIVYNEWSTFKKLLCAAKLGLPCIAEETGNCISSNCF